MLTIRLGVILFLTFFAFFNSITRGWALSNNSSYAVSPAENPEPVRRGNQSTRFEVRDGDCGADHVWNDCDSDRYRADLNPNTFRPNVGDDFWSFFSIYIPHDFVGISPATITLGAIGTNSPVENIGNSGQGVGVPKFNKNGASGSFLHFNVHDGYYNLVMRKRQEMYGQVQMTSKIFNLISIKSMRGKWTDVLVHVDFGDPDNIILDAWINGTKKVSNVHSAMGIIPTELHQVVGIYEQEVTKYHDAKDQALPTVIVYFDEMRVGRTREEVDPKANPALPPVD